MEGEFGMTNKLYEWTKELFKDGIELFSDTKVIVKNGVSINRNVAKLRKCSIGLISAATAEDWYNICRLNCDVGTIIEPFDERWNDLYMDMLLLVKATLTETLIDERIMEEPNHKMADRYLNILERRDKNHWSKDQKQLKVEQKEDKNLSITFDIV